MEAKDKYNVITKSPGKVLICGGYVIINPKFSGVVVTTDTYFECNSTIESYASSDVGSDLRIEYQITSEHLSATYKYIVEVKRDMNDCLAINFKDISDIGNDYIKNAAMMSSYFYILYNQNVKGSAAIKVNTQLTADYRFYGTDNSSKTGLGSSSALISSMVCNIFTLLNSIDKGMDSRNINIHDLKIEEQANILLSGLVANNLAQKKVRTFYKLDR
jgi:phosphomevalonate kinase